MGLKKLKRYHKHFLVYIFIIFISLFPLSSCTIINALLEEKGSSIILDTSCEPPCWENITPGKTTRLEVNNILHEITWINNKSIKDYSAFTENDSIKWKGTDDAGDDFGEILFKNDIVAIIQIFPKDGVLEFSKVIEKFCEPEFVFVTFYSRERTTISVDIIYPSLGIGFNNNYERSYSYTVSSIPVSAYDEVDFVWYSDPQNFIEYLISKPTGIYSKEFFELGIQQWKGYGKYESLNLEKMFSPTLQP
jgi:hypothetical protein